MKYKSWPVPRQASTPLSISNRTYRNIVDSQLPIFDIIPFVGWDAAAPRAPVILKALQVPQSLGLRKLSVSNVLIKRRDAAAIASVDGGDLLSLNIHLGRGQICHLACYDLKRVARNAVVGAHAAASTVDAKAINAEDEATNNVREECGLHGGATVLLETVNIRKLYASVRIILLTWNVAPWEKTPKNKIQHKLAEGEISGL
jgi:hypothetical protein